MGDARYDPAWDAWQEACEKGPEARQAFLAQAPEDVLIRALASDRSVNDPLGRNVLATALLNRRAAGSPSSTALPIVRGSAVKTHDAILRAAESQRIADMPHARPTRRPARPTGDEAGEPEAT